MWITSENKYTMEDMKRIHKALIVYEEHMKDEKERIEARYIQAKILLEIGEN